MKTSTRPDRPLGEVLPELGSRLEAKRERLLALLRSDAEALAMPAEDRGEDLTTSQHPADVASDLTAREDLLGMGRLYRRDLEQVDAALERIRDGGYGRCVDCGQPIQIERLDAFPQALRCLTCALGKRAGVRHGGRAR